VLGFCEAITNPSYQSAGFKFGITPKLIAGAVLDSFAMACAFLTKLGLDGHTHFLLGLEIWEITWFWGCLLVCTTFVSRLKQCTTNLLTHSLSQSWAIHFSSVFEFLFAIDLIWKFAETTDIPKWKGLTWGMLES